MRIIQVLPYAELGGTERHCLTLIRGLVARGHEVTLVSPEGPALATLDGCAHLPFARWDRDLRAGVKSFLSALRSIDADVVHVHAAAELVWAARWSGKTPVVFTVHGFHGRGAHLSYALARWAMRSARRSICVSEAERRLLPGAKVIHNGVEDPGFTPYPANGVVGYVGRLEPSKGVDVLIASGVRPLLIVGEGSGRADLEAKADSQVTFTGPRRDAVSLMAGCDVIAVPSRQEPFGLVAIEAAAVGRPVVASAVGGLKEIVVDGETGFLVPPEDPAALAAAIGRLRDDPALAVRLGLAGRRRYLDLFSAARMIEATEAVYRDVCPT